MAVPWTDYVVIDSTKLLAIVKYFRFEVVVLTPHCVLYDFILAIITA